MDIKSRIRFFGIAAVAILLLAGCSYASGDSGRMMGSSISYNTPTRSCSFPADLPGTVIRVNLGDMGMIRTMGGIAPLDVHMRLIATPGSVHAGVVSIVVFNNGWRIHELVILPLADGKKAGERIPGRDGKVDEAGSLGEASYDCGYDVGKGIRPGSTAWTTVNLKPGRYEFVCNLQNHYLDGMYQEVDVT